MENLTIKRKYMLKAMPKGLYLLWGIITSGYNCGMISYEA